LSKDTFRDRLRAPDHNSIDSGSGTSLVSLWCETKGVRCENEMPYSEFSRWNRTWASTRDRRIRDRQIFSSQVSLRSSRERLLSTIAQHLKTHRDSKSGCHFSSTLETLSVQIDHSLYTIEPSHASAHPALAFDRFLPRSAVSQAGFFAPVLCLGHVSKRPRVSRSVAFGCIPASVATVAERFFRRMDGTGLSRV
jgi:hypothetical protein